MAILAGWCFWGMQDLIRKLPGVISTRVGYTGGDVANATYRNHGTHAEAIEIIFDPETDHLSRPLEFFFQIHDPTTRTAKATTGERAIARLSSTRRRAARVAQDTIADVDASGLWPGKVVTEVAPAGPFWEAEPEHQDYLERYPDGYTATSRGRAGCCPVGAAPSPDTASACQGASPSAKRGSVGTSPRGETALERVGLAGVTGPDPLLEEIESVVLGFAMASRSFSGRAQRPRRKAAWASAPRDAKGLRDGGVALPGLPERDDLLVEGALGDLRPGRAGSTLCSAERAGGPGCAHCCWARLVRPWWSFRRRI